MSIGFIAFVALRRDHSKALSWFLKAVEKGEPRSMELLGEIYARGAGVERNYTKAFEWLTLASKHHLYSAYNGIGYLYVKGYGVDSKNYTKAKEYFEKAAENDEVGGHYNLGVMFLKGIGVKRDVRLACKYFIVAANNGQPKAFYQLAKIFHLGVGFKKNVPLGSTLYPRKKGNLSNIEVVLHRHMDGETTEYEELRAENGVFSLSRRVEAQESLSVAIEAHNKEDIEKFSKRTVKVTKENNQACKKLLKLMGVPVVEAPSEAEAQCGALCKVGKATSHLLLYRRG
ncbi:unnamed protein product [Vicia faba]|uniref:XPG-I domain-containing protein n=1 Tax=Vicia faba TaxID=3906 RepID=A0AAV0ZR27_VICFA|nr:unnamed protein product [Vicia faba]CAI8604696.1 unnamed protein product [Vicia faba]CAI8611205.1 unnamed protein product [Vicia faba]CAI8613534.1 unnamed protein product [Vicia faba]CAI8613549.1 unnamed protein product [Vicia faba]